jgi:hypothetical protein
MITSKYLLAKSVLDLNYGFKTFSEFDDFMVEWVYKAKSNPFTQSTTFW